VVVRRDGVEEKLEEKGAGNGFDCGMRELSCFYRTGS
jgi:hypothetical protein